jgi:peptide/nickel transport system permease protein
MMRGLLLVTRLLAMLATLLGVSLMVFLLMQAIPGDPVDAMLGERASGADRSALRQALGLDASLPEQLRRYYGGLLAGDWGRSLQTQEPILDMLAARAPGTLLLAGSAVLFALLLALPLGVWSALRPDRLPDHFAGAVALAGGAVPGFILGPVLIVVFAVWLGWAPVGGADTRGSVVLPALTLAIGMAAVLSRQLRAALLEVLREDFMRAARARGLGHAAALWRHGLRNAAIPVLTVLGMQLGALLGGAVITETVFSWPGLGTLTMEAIERRDYPLLQGCVLVISAAYVIINRLTDLITAWCDPRIDWSG